MPIFLNHKNNDFTPNKKSIKKDIYVIRFMSKSLTVAP